jgi:large subunit ribosomal protein L17e
MGKTKYSREPANPTKAVKASAKDLRIHFKNTYEVVTAIKGMNLVFA